MWARPAVQRGANVPDPYKMKELLADKEAMEKHAAKVRTTTSNYVLRCVCVLARANGSGPEPRMGPAGHERGRGEE